MTVTFKYGNILYYYPYRAFGGQNKIKCVFAICELFIKR